jgi:hypothetical protein
MTGTLEWLACVMVYLAAARAARAAYPTFLAPRDYALGAYEIAVADTNGNGFRTSSAS